MSEFDFSELLGDKKPIKKEKLQVESPKIIEKVKKTPVKKTKITKITKKKEINEDYEPTSDELRTALFLLTRDSKLTRKSNAIIIKGLKKAINKW